MTALTINGIPNIMPREVVNIEGLLRRSSVQMTRGISKKSETNQPYGFMEHKKLNKETSPNVKSANLRIHRSIRASCITFFIQRTPLLTMKRFNHKKFMLHQNLLS